MGPRVPRPSEDLGTHYSAPTVKQNLAAIRMCFDWMVTGGILATNPASYVRGPKHVVKKGKTPVLSADEAREFLDSIDTATVVGLRDRALIAVMVYSFARVGAVVSMRVGDYFRQRRRGWFRLHEKGGKLHDVPAHHNSEEYMEAYLEAAGFREERDTPLFRTAYRKTGQLTDNAMTRSDVLRMVKRRAKEASLSAATCCHTFRRSGCSRGFFRTGSSEGDEEGPPVGIASIVRACRTSCATQS